MRPPPLARQTSHPSAGDTGAPPVGGYLVVADPPLEVWILAPEETRLRVPDELVFQNFYGQGSKLRARRYCPGYKLSQSVSCSVGLGTENAQLRRRFENARAELNTALLLSKADCASVSLARWCSGPSSRGGKFAVRTSPPHHRSFYFCSFSLCESTAKIPLGLALRRAGVRIIPGNRYPGMWSASMQALQA